MENEEKAVLKVNPSNTEKKKVFGKVFGGKLNLRQRPAVESNILKVLDNGTMVQILNNKDVNFYKVLVDNTEGYCMKSFVEVRKDANK